MTAIRKAMMAAAGNAGGDNLYVEDVFSTYLYEGTGLDGNTAQTITNGIDIEGEGGLVWIQERDDGSNSYSYVADSERGSTKYLITQVTNAEGTQADAVTSFNSDGFTLGVDSIGRVNAATGSPLTGRKYASFSFRKAEKFFDVQTWTGNSVFGREIPHNLGSVPACIILKRTSAPASWYVYHEGVDSTAPEDFVLLLDLALARINSSAPWADTAPTDSVFTVGDNSNYNETGSTYVAYLFASDAGGFGDDGSESIIKCGSYTTDGSGNATVNLGFEPQWILSKRTNATGSWYIRDVMRGMPVAGDNALLSPNTSGAEAASSFALRPSATGFTAFNDAASQTNIYIAIRRPMKTPESGTEVYMADTGDGSGGSGVNAFTSGFPVDWGFFKSDTVQSWVTSSRLTQGKDLNFDSTNAEGSSAAMAFDFMDGWYDNSRTSAFTSWMFKRATGFMDAVAYSGSGSATTQAHNLGVAPELMIVKSRTDTKDWGVYNSADGAEYYTYLNSNGAKVAGGGSLWNDTAPTETVFSVGAGSDTNASSENYIAYLFATLDGVSKVGSYTGTGADLNVDCGFSAGARFILIKRTDSTGDWHVWDSLRGIVAGNDPYLLLNSTAAEVTSTDYIDPLSSGFTVTSSAPAALNASGGTYIFLAIA